MSAITVDQSLQSLLSTVTEVTELRDSAGNLLGIYTPKAKAEQALYERARKLFDPVELNRRLREEADTAEPFSDVVKRLESMSQQ